MKKLTTALFTLLTTFAGTASAGEVDNTLISYLRVAGDTLTIVVVENVSSPATCSTHSSNGRSFAVDLTTTGGKEIARLVTAAFLAGRPVKIVGTDLCTINSNKETTSDVYLK